MPTLIKLSRGRWFPKRNEKVYRVARSNAWSAFRRALYIFSLSQISWSWKGLTKLWTLVLNVHQFFSMINEVVYLAKGWNLIFGLNLLLHMCSIMSSWNSLQWNFRTCFHLRQCYKCLEKDGCDYKDTRLGSFCQFLLWILMKGHNETHLQLFLPSGYWWNNWR